MASQVIVNKNCINTLESRTDKTESKITNLQKDYKIQLANLKLELEKEVYATITKRFETELSGPNTTKLTELENKINELELKQPEQLQTDESVLKRIQALELQAINNSSDNSNDIPKAYLDRIQALEDQLKSSTTESSSGRTPLKTSPPSDPCEEYFDTCNRLCNTLDAYKAEGLIKITFTKLEDWTTDNRKVDIKKLITQTAFNMKQFTDLRKNKGSRGFAFFKIDGLNEAIRESKVNQLLDNRANHRGVLGISPYLPRNITRIESQFISLKKKKVIFRYDVTRSGHYLLSLNDGDHELKLTFEEKVKNGSGTAFYNESWAYQQTCSKVIVNSPTHFMTLYNPTLEDLQKLAKYKSDHVPESFDHKTVYYIENGKILPAPDNKVPPFNF